MFQDTRRCLRMLVEATVAVLILVLTVLILVTVARLTPGGAGEETHGGPIGTPEQIGDAVDEALADQ